MSTEMLTCPSCGSQVATSALLCPKCGRPNISTAFTGAYSALQSVETEPTLDTGSAGTAPNEDNNAGSLSTSQSSPKAQAAPPAVSEPPRPVRSPKEPPEAYRTWRREQPAANPATAKQAGQPVGQAAGSPSASARPQPDMTLEELKQALADTHYTPSVDPNTLLVGGEMPRQILRPLNLPPAYRAVYPPPRVPSATDRVAEYAQQARGAYRKLRELGPPHIPSVVRTDPSLVATTAVLVLLGMGLCASVGGGIGTVINLALLVGGAIVVFLVIISSLEDKDIFQ